MWISRESGRQTQPTLKRRVLDAFGLAMAFALLPQLVATRAGAVLEPHPGWIAVLVLAARYGGGGLFMGLIAAAGAVGIGSVVAGPGLVAPWSRLDSVSNLIAFGTCLAICSIASLHLRRQADLCERISALSDRSSETEATIEILRGIVAKLRARVDRTATSLSFLRDVAARLEGTDPVAAAEAAADLVLARTAASAAAVKVGADGFLAVRDARGPKAIAPPALHEADRTVPIRNGDDWVGVIALWGIPRSGIDDATAHDLALIASWCAPALAVAAWSPDEPAGRLRRVV